MNLTNTPEFGNPVMEININFERIQNVLANSNRVIVLGLRFNL